MRLFYLLGQNTFECLTLNKRWESYLLGQNTFECLTLNKRWESLKSKTEETQNILKKRLKCTMRRKSPERGDLGPQSSTPHAIKPTSIQNVGVSCANSVVPANCTSFSTPLKRSSQEEISKQLPFSPINPFPKAKKVLIVDSSTKISDFMDTSANMEWTRWRPHCTHRIKGADYEPLYTSSRAVIQSIF